MEPNISYEIQLTAFAFGGESIGRLPDGRAVFVPFAMPGEKVRVELVEERRGFARARLLEVLQPSPERVQPRCIHFGVCGGCDYQHMGYETQLQAKRTVVRDQLQRIGGIEKPNVLPVVPCPSEYYYRNTIQFHQNEDGRLGFIRHEGDQVLAIQECHLPQPVLNATWPEVQFEPISGLDRIGLRQGQDEDIILWLESQDPLPPELELESDLSAVHLSPAGAIVMAGDDHVVMELLGRSFKVSAGAFFQVNSVVAALMVEHLLESLPLTPATTLVDAYCGVGLFSAFLAPKVGKLIAIEENEAAIEDFAVNLADYEDQEISLYAGAVEEVLPGIQQPVNVVLVDPPRAGLDRKALDAIVALGPRVLAYISCDAATLARDVKRLDAGGYKLIQATPFDMFPQTYHVETVALLKKSGL